MDLAENIVPWLQGTRGNRTCPSNISSAEMGCYREHVVRCIWPEGPEPFKRDFEQRVVASIPMMVDRLVEEDSHRQNLASRVLESTPKARIGETECIISGGWLVRTSAPYYGRQRLNQQDLHIEPDAVIADVIHIEFHPLVVGDI